MTVATGAKPRRKIPRTRDDEWSRAEPLTTERIDDLQPGFFEIVAVACRDHQIMDKGSSRDQAVFDRHRPARGTKSCEQFRPTKPGFCFPRETEESLNAGVEPPLELCPPFSWGQKKNAEPDLAEDDGIDGNFSFVLS